MEPSSTHHNEISMITKKISENNIHEQHILSLSPQLAHRNFEQEWLQMVFDISTIYQ